MMRRKRYEFVLEAMSPIAHHAGTIGNHSHLMRTRVRTPTGWDEIPVISADTMRHKLREASSLALLDAIEAEPQLTEATLRLLFNGGMITGSDGGAVKLDVYREMIELVPALALFGGCAQNRIIPGRLTVENAMLICEETRRYISPWQVAAAEAVSPLDTHTRHIDEEQRVRMDALLNPHMRKMLASEAQIRANTLLEGSERASANNDAIEKSETKSAMMPRTAEVIATGSLFAWAVEADVNTDLDEDVFNVAVIAFLARAMVGGKQGTGHGRLRVLAANEIKIGTPSRDFEAFDTTALAPKVGQLFRAHVAARKDRIKDFLATVIA